MSNTVRCKFRVTKKEECEGSPITHNVTLVAVSGGSEENKSFWKYTPGGVLTLSCIKPEAVAMFDVGQEYYLDISKATAG